MKRGDLADTEFTCGGFENSGHLHETPAAIWLLGGYENWDNLHKTPAAIWLAIKSDNSTLPVVWKATEMEIL